MASPRTASAARTCCYTPRRPCCAPASPTLRSTQATRMPARTPGAGGCPKWTTTSERYRGSPVPPISLIPPAHLQRRWSARYWPSSPRSPSQPVLEWSPREYLKRVRQVQIERGLSPGPSPRARGSQPMTCEDPERYLLATCFEGTLEKLRP